MHNGSTVRVARWGHKRNGPEATRPHARARYTSQITMRENAPEIMLLLAACSLPSSPGLLLGGAWATPQVKPQQPAHQVALGQERLRVLFRQALQRLLGLCPAQFDVGTVHTV